MKCPSQLWLIFITSQLHDFLVASSANCKWRIHFRVSLLTQRTNERNEERRRLHFRVVPLFFRPRREREVSEGRRRTTKNARNYAPMHHLVL